MYFLPEPQGQGALRGVRAQAAPSASHAAAALDPDQAIFDRLAAIGVQEAQRRQPFQLLQSRIADRRARQVAAFMRAHGLWDDREFVTIEVDGRPWTGPDLRFETLGEGRVYDVKSGSTSLARDGTAVTARDLGLGELRVHHHRDVTGNGVETRLQGRPESRDGKTMEPLENYGVQVMSIGFLVDTDNPMIWRGPMATQALEQLLRQTNWNDLDYLIVDMPPGTGDIQLTLSQRVPLTGAVIVTTPQDIALLDARKGIKMFEKVGVPILGIVENMAVHVCSNCGHVEHIFGEDGGILARSAGQTDEVFRLRAIGHSLQQAFERYYIAISVLVKNGPLTFSSVFSMMSWKFSALVPRLSRSSSTIWFIRLTSTTMPPPHSANDTATVVSAMP